MNEELKPCPFCGSKNLCLIRNSWYWVQCNNCLAEIGVQESEKDAIEKWNRRADDEID